MSKKRGLLFNQPSQSGLITNPGFFQHCLRFQKNIFGILFSVPSKEYIETIYSVYILVSRFSAMLVFTANLAFCLFLVLGKILDLTPKVLQIIENIYISHLRSRENNKFSLKVFQMKALRKIKTATYELNIENHINKKASVLFAENRGFK